VTICRVLLCRPKPEMPRIATPSFISSGTVVTDMQLGWNFPKVDHPTNAMRGICIPCNPEPPVSSTFASGVKPAFVRSSLLHVSPKAGVVFLSQLWQKAASRVRIHRAGSVRARRPVIRFPCSFFFTGLIAGRQCQNPT
jgi:hypothetical protein